MPRQESKATVNNFIGGLVSDFHELNTPENVTVDELNCDLDRRGSRKRRLGMDFEEGSTSPVTTFTDATFATLYPSTFEWLGVAEDGNINFLVVQAGSFLSFFDLNFDPLSAGQLPFTVDLDDFRAPAYSTTAPYAVQMDHGKGALFVVGEAINPFFIQYDPVSNTITTTQLNLKIRDLKLQDNALKYTDQPTTLTFQQRYDLNNQGWNAKANCEQASDEILHETNVLDFFFNFTGKYPEKSKSWWVGKHINIKFGADCFNCHQYNTAYFGNQLAPLGTYILDAFYQDRSAVSGIAGFSPEVDNSRPTAVAFGAGRVFYGFKNKIMFSQVIVDDFTVAERCYQQADPTAEKLNDLVATDGGIIQIIESATIVALKSFENAVFAYSANGVWALGGSAVGAGFSATDFSIYKVTEAGALSGRTFISMEGQPIWWSKLGIYTLQGDAAKQGYTAVNILEKKLQLFYNAIPPTSKLYAAGTYDKTKKVLTWIYNSVGTPIGGNPYCCDNILLFDLIFKSFYLYKISPSEGANSPYIVSVFNVKDIQAVSSPEAVITELGNPVVAEDLTTVDANITVLGNAGNTNSSIKFLTFFKTAA